MKRVADGASVAQAVFEQPVTIFFTNGRAYARGWLGEKIMGVKSERLAANGLDRHRPRSHNTRIAKDVAATEIWISMMCQPLLLCRRARCRVGLFDPLKILDVMAETLEFGSLAEVIRE